MYVKQRLKKRQLNATLVKHRIILDEKLNFTALLRK